MGVEGRGKREREIDRDRETETERQREGERGRERGRGREAIEGKDGGCIRHLLILMAHRRPHVRKEAEYPLLLFLSRPIGCECTAVNNPVYPVYGTVMYAWLRCVVGGRKYTTFSCGGRTVNTPVVAASCERPTGKRSRKQKM